MKGKVKKSIWHDATEEPTEHDDVLVKINLGYNKRTGEDIIYYDVISMSRSLAPGYDWENYIYHNEVEKWCYISDLENL